MIWKLEKKATSGILLHLEMADKNFDRILTELRRFWKTRREKKGQKKTDQDDLARRYYKKNCDLCYFAACCNNILAERERFELSRHFHAHTLSRRAPSTTRPPLQKNFREIISPEILCEQSKNLCTISKL